MSQGRAGIRWWRLLWNDLTERRFSILHIIVLMVASMIAVRVMTP